MEKIEIHVLDVLCHQSKKELDAKTYTRWDAMRHVNLTYQLNVALVLVPNVKEHLSKKL